MADNIVWDDEKPDAGIVWDDEKPKKTPDSVLSRVATGLMDPVHGAAQLADRYLVDPIRQRISPGATSMQDVTRQRDAEYAAPEGVDWARMGGNLANPVTWAGGGAGPLRAAYAGGLQGALSPVAADADFAAEKAQQAGLGAAGGAILSKALRGINATPEARSLMDQGVTLTPGQAAGAGSFVKKAEEYLGTLPIASHFIKGAQNRAVEDANVAAVQTVRNMVGEGVKLGKPPREAIEQTREAISNAYTQALEGVSVPLANTANAMQDLLPTIARDHPMIPASEIEQAGRYIQGRFRGLWDGGVRDLTGDQIKQIDSEIGQHIRDLAKSTNAADKTAVPLWRDLQQEVRNRIVGGIPIEQGAQLHQANAAYRQLLMLENAMLPGNDVFTPRRLKMTLERMNKNQTPNTELGKISQAMSATLPNQVPSSGTAERLLVGGLPALLMGGGAGAHEAGYGTLGTGMMAAGALGSRPGARIMTGRNFAQKALAPYDDQLAATTIAALRGRNRDE